MGHRAAAASYGDVGLSLHQLRAGIEAARKRFRNYYDAKDYAKARDMLRPLATFCFGEDYSGTGAAQNVRKTAGRRCAPSRSLGHILLL